MLKNLPSVPPKSGNEVLAIHLSDLRHIGLLSGGLPNLNFILPLANRLGRCSLNFLNLSYFRGNDWI